MAEWDDFLTDLPNELLTEPIEQNNNLNLLEELDEWMHSNSSNNNNNGQNNSKEARSDETSLNVTNESILEGNISDTNDNLITQQNKLKELLQQQLQKPVQNSLNSQQQTISFLKLPTLRPLYVQNNNKNNQLQSMHITLQQPQQQFNQISMPQQLILQSQQPKVIIQPTQNILLQQPFKQQIVNMTQNHVNLPIKKNCDNTLSSNNNTDDYFLIQLGNQIFKVNKNQQNLIPQQPNQNILQQPNQNILQSQQLKILQQQLDQQKITLSQKQQHKIILQTPSKQSLVTTSATQPPTLHTPLINICSTTSTTIPSSIITSTPRTTVKSLDLLLPTSKMTLKSSVNNTDQTRQQKLERHLLKDQRSATFPELHTKFETLRDTVRCLVPYHVMACGTDDDDDVQKAEEKFEVMCQRQLDRHNAMLKKFQKLLLVKSMKHVDASEEVMMGRLFVLHERDRLKKERQAVLNNEKFRPRPSLNDEDKLKYAHIIDSLGDEVTENIVRVNTIETKRRKSDKMSTENQTRDKTDCSDKNNPLKANVGDVEYSDDDKERGKANNVNHDASQHEIRDSKSEDTFKNVCTDKKFTNLRIKDKRLKQNIKDIKRDLTKQKLHNVMGNVKKKEDSPVEDEVDNKLCQEINEKEINLKQKKVGILAKIFNKHKNTTNHSKSNGLNNDKGLNEDEPCNFNGKTKSNLVKDPFNNSEVCLKRTYTTTFNKYNKDSIRISNKRNITHAKDDNGEHTENNGEEAKNGLNSLVIRIGKHKKRSIEKIPTIKIVRSKISDVEDDEHGSEMKNGDEAGCDGLLDVYKKNKVIGGKDFKSKIRLKLNHNSYKNDELYSNSILKTNSDDEYDDRTYNDNENDSIASNDEHEVFVKKNKDILSEKIESSFKPSKKKHKDKKIVVKEIFQRHDSKNVSNEQPCDNSELNGSVDNDRGLFKLKISKESLKINIDTTNNLSEEDLAVANLLSNQSTNGTMDTQQYNIFGDDQFSFMDDMFSSNQDYNTQGRVEGDEDETESAIKNLIALQ